MSVSTRSGPYIFLYLIVVFLIGGLLITMIMPFFDGMKTSALFTFDTRWGKDLADWFIEVMSWIGLIGLLAIVYSAFITSRRGR